jgi:hypothetical protein
VLYLLVVDNDDVVGNGDEITLDDNVGDLQVFKVDVAAEPNFGLDKNALLTDNNDELFDGYDEELLTSGVISFRLI